MINNTQSQSVTSGAVGSPYQISRPLGALIFRLIVGVPSAVGALLTLVQVLVQGPPDDGLMAVANWLSIGMGALFGLPSLVVAGGLLFRKKWALWAAVIYDAVILVPVLAYMTSAFMVPAGPLTWLLLVPLVPFLVEGFLLARMIWDRERYCLAVALSLCLGMSIPAISRHAYAARYRPLLGYVRSHWINLSPEYRVYTGGPRDDVSIRLRNDIDRSEVFLYFRPVGKGRWLFEGSSSLGKHGPALDLRNYDRMGHLDSVPKALETLRSQGVRVADLKHVGTLGRSPDLCYVFESTKAGGTYTVSGMASEVQFYPLKTTIVPSD